MLHQAGMWPCEKNPAERVLKGFQQFFTVMLQPLFILQQILEIYLMSNILDFTEKNLQKKMNLFEFLEIMFSLEFSTNLLKDIKEPVENNLQMSLTIAMQL